MRKMFFILFLISLSIKSFAQFYSFRTNALGMMTGNFNLEYGMTLNKKWSAHFPVQYNPLVYSDTKNTKFENLTIMPGVRCWFNESYRGKFIGVYSIASQFNISNIWDSYRYEGKGLGAGISIGSAYPISSRWNFEWEAGIGMIWCSFDKYVARRNGFHFGHYMRWHIIPSKISFNLVYLF